MFTAIVTPAIGYYAVVNMAVNGNMADMIRDDMPHRIVELEYRRSFPVLYENIVVVVDAPTPEQARTSALDLAERMRQWRHSGFSALAPASLYLLHIWTHSGLQDIRSSM